MMALKSHHALHKTVTTLPTMRPISGPAPLCSQRKGEKGEEDDQATHGFACLSQGKTGRATPRSPYSSSFMEDRSLSVFSTNVTSGLSSPAGSSSDAATFSVLTTQFLTSMVNRLQRGLPSTDMGPGWSPM